MTGAGGMPRVPTVSQTPRALILISVVPSLYVSRVRCFCCPWSVPVDGGWLVADAYPLQALLVDAHAGVLPLDLVLAVKALLEGGQPFDQVLVGITAHVANVLIVFKDAVEVVQSLGREQTDRRDHVGGGAGGEGAAGEADEEDLVAVDVVGADEVVDEADVAVQAHAKGAAGELVNGVGGAHAGKVRDDLVGSVRAVSAEAPGEPRHVGGGLEAAMGERGSFVELEVTYLPFPSESIHVPSQHRIRRLGMAGLGVCCRNDVCCEVGAVERAESRVWLLVWEVSSDMLGRRGGADSTEAVGRDGGGSLHRGNSQSYGPSCRVPSACPSPTRGPAPFRRAEHTRGLRVRVRPGAGPVRQLRDGGMSKGEGMGGMAGDDWATPAPSPLCDTNVGPLGVFLAS